MKNGRKKAQCTSTMGQKHKHTAANAPRNYWVYRKGLIVSIGSALVFFFPDEPERLNVITQIGTHAAYVSLLFLYFCLWPVMAIHLRARTFFYTKTLFLCSRWRCKWTFMRVLFLLIPVNEQRHRRKEWIKAPNTTRSHSFWAYEITKKATTTIKKIHSYKLYT